MTTSRGRVRSLVVSVPLIVALTGCGADRAADPETGRSVSPSSTAATDAPTDSPYSEDQVVASLEVTGGICGPRCDEETIVLGDRSWNRTSAVDEEFGELDEAEWQALLASLDATALDDMSLKQRRCPGVADFRTVTYAWTVDDTIAEVGVCDLVVPTEDPLVQWWETLLSSR